MPRFRRYRRTFRARGGRFRRFRRRLNQRPIRAQLRRLNRVVSPEFKVVDRLVYNSVGLNTTWNIQNISLISRGVLSSERIGDRVRVTSIQLRGAVRGLGTARRQKCRIILLARKQDDSVALIASDVFNSSSTTPWAEFKNWDTRFKTKFIFDKVYMTVPNDTVTVTHGTGNLNEVQIRKKFRMSHNINYNVTSATGSLVQDGALYLMVAGNNGSTAEGPNLFLNVRIIYQDM